MSFERGWRQRRAAAQSRAGRTGNPAYREYSAEMKLREAADSHLANFRTRHQRLVDEKAMLDRELTALQERAAEDNKIVGPSHPVVLKLREMPALITEAARDLRSAEAEYKRKMRESDTRLTEMKVRHEFEADRAARADAAAEAAHDKIMAEEMPK